VGSILGLVNLVGGVPGLLAGGYLVDRFGKQDIRWRMRIPALALMLALPCFLAGLWQGTALGMSILMGVGIFLYQASHAPGLAVVQSSVAPNMRALAASLVFLFANMLGLGLGPLVVGSVSDVSMDEHGSGGALRLALVCAMLVLLPAIYWYWKTATSLGMSAVSDSAVSHR
jgi:MFS family permease